MKTFYNEYIYISKYNKSLIRYWKTIENNLLQLKCKYIFIIKMSKNTSFIMIEIKFLECIALI